MHENTNQTLLELSRSIGRIEGSVASLESKLNDVFELLAVNREASTKKHDGFHERISSLERDRAKVVGGAVAAGGIVSFIINHFKDLLHK